MLPLVHLNTEAPMPRKSPSNPAPWIAMCISRTTYYKRIAEGRARELLYAALPECYHTPAGLVLDKAIQAFCTEQGYDYAAILHAIKVELVGQAQAPLTLTDKLAASGLTLRKLSDIPTS